MAKFSLGDSITPEAVRGDPLTIISDATLPFGMNSRTCDGSGLPAQRTVIIADGRLEQLWAGQRRAHYLETKPTGAFANLVIPEGSRSVAQLSQGAEVLEVVRFSWLTPDRGTGDFSSEIRFGYMHRDGRKIPIKGGSVNGNIFGALEDCHFSRERDFVGDALVPSVVRFNELEVFGA
jgi:PmbA protein